MQIRSKTLLLFSPDWGYIDIQKAKSDMKNVIQPTYDEINKEYGLNEKQEK